MIDRQKLIQRLTADIDYFRQFGDVVETHNGPLIYQDNGSKILAVAHLDVVMKQKPKLSKNGGRIYAPQLDDRLGAHILLDVLPEFIEFDLLLTTNEECGASTAEFFESEREYNWMFEFDRALNDVVTYQYESEDWELALSEFFGFPNYGSYTDICDLDHLGICGVNVGCGYNLQHTTKCYADLSMTEKMIQRFLNFHHVNSEIRFEHSPTIRNWTTGNYIVDDYQYSDDYFQRRDWDTCRYIDEEEFCGDCGALLDLWAECPDCKSILQSYLR